MKTETIEEFIARGGKVITLPPAERPEVKNQLKTMTTPEGRLLTLGEGEFYFSESKNRKPAKRTVRLADVVDKFNLPKDIADRLRGSNVRSKE